MLVSIVTLAQKVHPNCFLCWIKLNLVPSVITHFLNVVKHMLAPVCLPVCDCWDYKPTRKACFVHFYLFCQDYWEFISKATNNREEEIFNKNEYHMKISFLLLKPDFDLSFSFHSRKKGSTWSENITDELMFFLANYNRNLIYWILFLWWQYIRVIHEKEQLYSSLNIFMPWNIKTSNCIRFP